MRMPSAGSPDAAHPIAVRTDQGRQNYLKATCPTRRLEGGGGVSTAHGGVSATISLDGWLCGRLLMRLTT